MRPSRTAAGDDDDARMNLRRAVRVIAIRGDCGGEAVRGAIDHQLVDERARTQGIAIAIRSKSEQKSCEYSAPTARTGVHVSFRHRACRPRWTMEFFADGWLDVAMPVLVDHSWRYDKFYVGRTAGISDGFLRTELS